MLSEYQVETIEKDKLSPGKHQKSIPNLGNKKIQFLKSKTLFRARIEILKEFIE